MIDIRETTASDLKNVQALWADGDVMKYVGFPQGLVKDDNEMADWLKWIEGSRPKTNHYSVYSDGVYCGETFYSIDDETKRAALDIKLFSHARGKGIASSALKYAIDRAFENGAASAYVDPKPENEKALALYKRLGMERKKTPPELFDKDYPEALFFEISKKK